MTFSKCVIVIPAKNEASNIGMQVKFLLSLGVKRVYVADDNSIDETSEVASAAGAKIITIPVDRIGLAGAYRYALTAASVYSDQRSIIIEMDAGGSHSVSDLLKFVKEFQRIPDLDVVFGRRFGDGAKYEAPFNRKFLSWGGTLLTNFMDPFGYQWQDATSGFIAYKPVALKKLLNCHQIADGHYYQTEMRRNAKLLRLKVTEVPITYTSSVSSLKFKDVIESLRLSIK